MQTAEGMKRNASAPGLSANAVSQAFAGPEGHVANADGAGAARILLKVDKVTAPAFFAEAADVKNDQDAALGSAQKDIFSTYNQQLLALRSTSINNAAYQQMTGQDQAQ